MNQLLFRYASGIGIISLLVFCTGAVLAFQGDLGQNNSQTFVQLARFQSNASGQHLTSPGSTGNPGAVNHPVPQTKKLSPGDARRCFDQCMNTMAGPGAGGTSARFCGYSCR